MKIKSRNVFLTALFNLFFFIRFGCAIQKGSIVGKKCEYILREKSLEFTSPGYPEFYPNEAKCKWTIIAQPGYHIQLTIINVNIEESKHCSFDAITIYDGQGDTAIPIRKLCGTRLPESLQSVSNVFTIVMETDGYGNGRGFQMKYETVPACMVASLGDTGEMKSPGFPLGYPDGISCTFHFPLLEVGKFIHIYFEDFKLEEIQHYECFDHLSIITMSEKGDEKVEGQFCGTTLKEKSLCFKTGQLSMRLVTDKMWNTRGFKVSYLISDDMCSDKDNISLLIDDTVHTVELTDLQVLQQLLDRELNGGAVTPSRNVSLSFESSFEPGVIHPTSTLSSGKSSDVKTFNSNNKTTTTIASIDLLPIVTENIKYLSNSHGRIIKPSSSILKFKTSTETLENIESSSSILERIETSSSSKITDLSSDNSVGISSTFQKYIKPSSSFFSTINSKQNMDSKTKTEIKMSSISNYLIKSYSSWVISSGSSDVIDLHISSSTVEEETKILSGHTTNPISSANLNVPNIEIPSSQMHEAFKVTSIKSEEKSSSTQKPFFFSSRSDSNKAQPASQIRSSKLIERTSHYSLSPITTFVHSDVYSVNWSTSSSSIALSSRNGKKTCSSEIVTNPSQVKRREVTPTPKMSESFTSLPREESLESQMSESFTSLPREQSLKSQSGQDTHFPKSSRAKTESFTKSTYAEYTKRIVASRTSAWSTTVVKTKSNVESSKPFPTSTVKPSELFIITTLSVSSSQNPSLTRSIILDSGLVTQKRKCKKYLKFELHGGQIPLKRLTSKAKELIQDAFESYVLDVHEVAWPHDSIVGKRGIMNYGSLLTTDIGDKFLLKVVQNHIHLVQITEDIMHAYNMEQLMILPLANQAETVRKYLQKISVTIKVSLLYC